MCILWSLWLRPRTGAAIWQGMMRFSANLVQDLCSSLECHSSPSGFHFWRGSCWHPLWLNTRPCHGRSSQGYNCSIARSWNGKERRKEPENRWSLLSTCPQCLNWPNRPDFTFKSLIRALTTSPEWVSSNSLILALIAIILGMSKWLINKMP